MSVPNPKVLLVASKTGYQVREFARHAERLGYQVQLATDRCHVLDDPWADGAIPIRFEEPWTAPSQVAGMTFDGVIAVGDKPAYVAALIGEYLNVPFHSVEAVRASRNKFEMRRRFAQAGLLVPAYRRVSLEVDPQPAAEETEYPCVLKPLGLSASRGVIRADTPDEFIRAFERIRALLASPDILRMHRVRTGSFWLSSSSPARSSQSRGSLRRANSPFSRYSISPTRSTVLSLKKRCM